MQSPPCSSLSSQIMDFSRQRGLFDPEMAEHNRDFCGQQRNPEPYKALLEVVNELYKQPYSHDLNVKWNDETPSTAIGLVDKQSDASPELDLGSEHGRRDD